MDNFNCHEHTNCVHESIGWVFYYKSFGHLISLSIFNWLLSLSFGCTHKTIWQKSDANLNVIELIFPLVMLSWSFLLLFFFAECGERVANQYNLFDDEYCQCNWYAFSLKLQRMYALAMSNIQQSAILHGYANTVCTRDAFKQTINGGFSYFMMLRQMEW